MVTAWQTGGVVSWRAGCWVLRLSSRAVNEFHLSSIHSPVFTFYLLSFSPPSSIILHSWRVAVYHWAVSAHYIAVSHWSFSPHSSIADTFPSPHCVRPAPRPWTRKLIPIKILCGCNLYSELWVVDVCSEVLRASFWVFVHPHTHPERSSCNLCSGDVRFQFRTIHGLSWRLSRLPTFLKETFRRVSR